MRLLFFLFIITFALFSKEPLKMPKDFRTVLVNKATILQDGKSKFFCIDCGMYLPKFYRTNHAAIIDGKQLQFCSIHCLVEAMQRAKDIKDIKVVDNSTLKFIDVNKAWYVVGSKKQATMSSVSKYAFGTKEKAQEFAKKFGGELMQYKSVIAFVKSNLKKDIAMVSKRQAKMAKMGKMVLSKKCKSVNQEFTNVSDAKTYIKSNKLCKDISGKELQAIGLFLVKGKELLSKNIGSN